MTKAAVVVAMGSLASRGRPTEALVAPTIVRGDGGSISMMMGTEGSVGFAGGHASWSDEPRTQPLEIPPELGPPIMADYPADDPRSAFTAFELPSFIRPAEECRHEITGAKNPSGQPATPTFADGPAPQKVCDGIRSSPDAGGIWIEIEQEAL